jgi:hypothetical protein
MRKGHQNPRILRDQVPRDGAIKRLDFCDHKPAELSPVDRDDQALGREPILPDKGADFQLQPVIPRDRGPGKLQRTGLADRPGMAQFRVGPPLAAIVRTVSGNPEIDR